MHAPQTNRRSIVTPAASQSRFSKRGDGSQGVGWRWLPIAAMLMGWISSASAAEYAIQVGAFKSPSQSYAENLRSYGEVNTAQSSSGVTVFTVGRYGSVAEAKEDLNRIADAYPGAFVRNMPAAARSADFAATQTSAAPQASKSTPDTQLWESLSESERRRVVYLDGVLHLKQGDQFVPLDEYRRSQNQ